ncbi:MBL fold metallo-hydrolase [Conexibacter woesei]|uniref:Beta-lactamase domain protein n=1 Tax=Conexibacter woesei (strain DSM 14684 / CCUG 47730 / CIP 108061 / JCM 11494 / NBRC 100937 / ID131577) TaxID=469383 RepID=D3FB90_CONWI|nr:MBL fold metallo-hydrolase [Conexibacter woesei]ADB53282.1 beta-lactamase domain protein [Conexibacter woesei DSM 14684]
MSTRGLDVTEVVPGIHRIASPLGERPMAQWLCVGSERILLVDSGVAGTPAAAIVPALAGLGLTPADLTDVVISHADVDHYGGDAELRALAPAARFVAHPADRPQIESFAAITAARYGWYRDYELDYPPQTWEWLRDAAGADAPLDGDVAPGADEAASPAFDLGGGMALELLHLPGHSAGHLGLLHRASATAIVLDAVMGDGFRSYDGALVSPTPYGDLAAYRGSIATLRALAPARLGTAHFPLLRGDEVAAFLDLSERWVDALDAAVLAALGGARDEAHGRGATDRARSLAELLQACDAAVGPYPEATVELARCIGAHLDAHVAAGRVVRLDGSPPRWALA